jgi:saccharopine dehydrogenase-like NADP-dependent oxidoreductase
MKKILIIGAGRSATTLINYLLNESVVNDWLITIADYNLILAEKAANNHKNANPIQFDVTNNVEREKQISKSNIVVSMLPAAMHILVAKDCVKFKKNLVTASYVSKEIKALNNLAIDSGIILLNEIGLDPGIDHLSAMKVIDKIKDNGHTLTSFKSFCGGLIHPRKR